MTSSVLQEAYRHAGYLLLSVVDELITAKTAIFQWPRLSDPSLQSAYQALWHFEADCESYHQTIPYYADVQLQWLAQLGARLSQGLPLESSALLGYRHSVHRIRFYDRPNLWVEQVKDWAANILLRR